MNPLRAFLAIAASGSRARASLGLLPQPIDEEIQAKGEDFSLLLGRVRKWGVHTGKKNNLIKKKKKKKKKLYIDIYTCRYVYMRTHTHTSLSNIYMYI